MHKKAAKQNPILDAILKALPPHTDAELEAMTADIQQKGQLVPILMKGKEVVDGRARLQICKKLGIKPITHDLGSAANDVDWAVSVNLFRRHLTTGQRAIFAEDLASLRKGSNQHTAKAACSRKVAAQRMGVSEDSIDRARKVKEGGSSKLFDMVRRGKVSLDAAANLVKSYPDTHQQDEILVKGIARVKKDIKKKDIIDGKRKEAQKLAQNNEAALETLQGTYSVIYADPPWDYGGGNEGADCDPAVHYPVMPLEDIKALPVKNCIDKDSALFLWVPSCLLLQGLEVMEAWGFTYASSMVWCKTRAVPSMGPTKIAHEYLLIGRRGIALHDITKRLKSWVAEEATVHSKKPAVFGQMIDAMYPGFPKLEMFARNKRPGWSVYGNQVVEVESKLDAFDALPVDSPVPTSKGTELVAHLDLNKAQVLNELFATNDPRSLMTA